METREKLLKEIQKGYLKKLNGMDATSENNSFISLLYDYITENMDALSEDNFEEQDSIVEKIKENISPIPKAAVLQYIEILSSEYALIKDKHESTDDNKNDYISFHIKLFADIEFCIESIYEEHFPYIETDFEEIEKDIIDNTTISGDKSFEENLSTWLNNAKKTLDYAKENISSEDKRKEKTALVNFQILGIDSASYF